MREKLGQFFMKLREQATLFKWLMFAALALILILNLFVRPEHPHIPVENEFGLWPAFAFFGGVVMIYVIKRILANLLAVPEEFYDGNDS